MLTDEQVGLAGEVALLLLAGFAIGLVRRRAFSPAWLLAAAALVVLNDAMLTRVWSLAPRLFPHGHWNWQGKLMALAATLAVVSLAAFGWRRSGLTLRQARGSLRPALALSAVYALVFVALALAFPQHGADAETVAFQLTLPGLEEEPFYRGVLILALDRAFRDRARIAGAEIGWGAVLSCLLFGLAHALGFAQGAFTFDAITMALTALPSFLAVWIRLRTGSVAIPIGLHNFGNAIGLLV